MPFRKTTKKTFSRRKFARRPRHVVPKYKPRNMGYVSGMPLTRRYNMRYNTTENITSTTGALGSFVFRANSLFDPNVTAAGHQPMGYDQWTMLYSKYVVTGSKITVRFMSGAAASPIVFGACITDGSAIPYTTHESYIEAKKGTWRVVSSNPARPPQVTSTYSARKFFNVTDIKDNLLRLGAGTISHPVATAFYVVWAQQISTTTSVIVPVNVTIDYTGFFSEPIDIAAS